MIYEQVKKCLKGELSPTYTFTYGSLKSGPETRDLAHWDLGPWDTETQGLETLGPWNWDPGNWHLRP